MKEFIQIRINNMNDGDIEIINFNIKYKKERLKVGINGFNKLVKTNIKEDNIISITAFSDKIDVEVL